MSKDPGILGPYSDQVVVRAQGWEPPSPNPGYSHPGRHTATQSQQVTLVDLGVPTYIAWTNIHQAPGSHVK